MQVLSLSISNFEDAQTGLYAERDKQIKLLIAERNRIHQIIMTEGAKSGAIEKAGLEQYDAINKKIVEVNKQFNDQIKELSEDRENYIDKIEEYIKQQKQLIKDFNLEFGREQAKEAFGDVGGELFDQVEEFSQKIRDMLGSGFDPNKVAYIIERQALKLREDLAKKSKQIFSDFADQLLGLQEELFDVLNEGRATGAVQKSQEDKVNEVRRKIKALYEEQQSIANGELAQFGTNIDVANEALQRFTQQLQTNYQNAIADSRAGLTDLDTIGIVVHGADAIADAVERRVNNLMSLPGSLRTAIV
jgi:hypothetical protein